MERCAIFFSEGDDAMGLAIESLRILNEKANKVVNPPSLCYNFFNDDFDLSQLLRGKKVKNSALCHS